VKGGLGVLCDRLQCFMLVGWLSAADAIGAGGGQSRCHVKKRVGG